MQGAGDNPASSDPSREQGGSGDGARTSGPGADRSAQRPERREPGTDLALELTGGLPCVRCTYDLRGLSVRGVCPECGTPIRATILARVDPLAKELQPLYTPKLTAGCLILWSGAALAGAVAAWVPRAIEGLNRLGRTIRHPEWPAVAVVICVALSGLASLALVRPHRGIAPWQSWAALLAAMLYAPLVLVIYRVSGVLDGRDPSPYLGIGGIDPARATWRLIADVLMMAIIVGLRPNARVLAARSFVLRTGQVDRQTMLAMAAAVAVCGIGDVLAILSGGAAATAAGPAGALADVLRIASMLFVGVGSLLFTLGLASTLIDVLRLVPVVAEPPLALSDITRPAIGAGRAGLPDLAGPPPTGHTAKDQA